MSTTMKLVVNTLLGLGLQAVAEAIALGEKAGIEKNRLLDVLGQMAVISPAHKLKRENARRNEYPVNSVAMPATAAAHQVCAIEQVKGVKEDYSALIRLMGELAQP